MKDFRELEELVKKKGFGTALYGNVNGQPVYLSRGIREIYLGDGDISQVIDFVNRFENGDFGDAGNFGKKQVPGHEYGRYESSAVAPTQEEGEDTAVWVHRDDDAVIVYYKFER